MITGIIAIAQNFAIGRDGRLPWHYPADLKFFKETTLNQAIVMGFNTWKSIGRALPKRLNIVLSRSNMLEHQPNVLLVRDRAEALALSKYLNCDLFIIGGAETYKNFAEVIEKWIVTEVPVSVEDADIFMPRDFLDEFVLQEKMQLEDNLQVKVFTRS